MTALRRLVIVTAVVLASVGEQHSQAPAGAADVCAPANPLACGEGIVDAVDGVIDTVRDCAGERLECAGEVAEAAERAGVPGAGTASGAVGAAQVASDPLGSVSSWLIDGVTFMVTLVATGVDRQLASSTLPELDAGWFVGHYNLVFGLALVLMVAAFVLQVLRGVVQSDPTALGRAMGGAAVSVVGSFAVLGVVMTVVRMVDEMSTGMVSLSSESLVDFNARWVEAGVAAFGPAGWLVVLILYGVVALFALVLMWLVLMLRSGAIYVLCAFAPLAFAAYGWERTRAVLARWGQVLGGLIFSKLVMYAVFSIGAHMLEGSLDPQDGLGGLTLFIQAMVVLVLATLAPWMTVRFFSWAGAGLGQAHSLAAPGNMAGPALGAAAVGYGLGKRGASVIGNAISPAGPGGVGGGGEEAESGGVDEEQLKTAALAAGTGGAGAAAGAGGAGASSSGAAVGGGGAEGAGAAGDGGMPTGDTDGGSPGPSGGSASSPASGGGSSPQPGGGPLGEVGRAARDSAVDLAAPTVEDTGDATSGPPVPPRRDGSSTRPEAGGGETVIGDATASPSSESVEGESDG